MKISIIVVLIGVLINSCGKDKLIQATKFPYISPKSSVYMPHLLTAENSYRFSISHFEFFYIGKLKDSILLENISFSPQPPPDLSGKKSVFIETNTSINTYDRFRRRHNTYDYSIDSLIEIQVNTSIVISKSYPVLVRNLNKDTVAIGYGDYIPLLLEAKDSVGNWKPIQVPYRYRCGTGLETIILPPKEIVITMLPIFNGNYKTQLRLTYGSNMSKPFWGKIDYKQFKINKL